MASTLPLDVRPAYIEAQSAWVHVLQQPCHFSVLANGGPYQQVHMNGD